MNLNSGKHGLSMLRSSGDSIRRFDENAWIDVERSILQDFFYAEEGSEGTEIGATGPALAADTRRLESGDQNPIEAQQLCGRARKEKMSILAT
ncbi:hypothetical protein Bca52824_080347 [Brassica carinata]|uniref:Uncharacterized protein n=1 Tax=Brassica carinata TaxID=52824 RepID=A0A8X7PE03_BRACI|nr:hypothetical protein Bca52824_080347 [Brassica carinata]